MTQFTSNSVVNLPKIQSNKTNLLEAANKSAVPSHYVLIVVGSFKDSKRLEMGQFYQKYLRDLQKKTNSISEANSIISGVLLIYSKYFLHFFECYHDDVLVSFVGSLLKNSDHHDLFKFDNSKVLLWKQSLVKGKSSATLELLVDGDEKSSPTDDSTDRVFPFWFSRIIDLKESTTAASDNSDSKNSDTAAAATDPESLVDSVSDIIINLNKLGKELHSRKNELLDKNNLDIVCNENINLIPTPDVLNSICNSSILLSLPQWKYLHEQSIKMDSSFSNVELDQEWPPFSHEIL